MTFAARQFEEHALPALSEAVRTRRWFRSKSKNIRATTLEDFSSFESSGDRFVLPVVRFAYDDGSSESYFVPLLLSVSGRDSGESLDFPVHVSGSTMHFSDALYERSFVGALLSLISRGGTISFGRGHADCHSMVPSADMHMTDGEQMRVISSEQSNTSVVIGTRAIYKSYRKMEEGINPDYEVPEFLYRHSSFRSLPRPLGRVEYVDGAPRAVGVLSEYVQNEGDCWTYFQGRLVPSLKNGSCAGVCFEHIPALADITSSLHNALSGATLPAFAPSAVSPADVEGWARNYTSLLGSTCSSLRRKLDKLDGPDRRLAELFLSREESLASHASSLRVLVREKVFMTRIHGDYHLGQILKAGNAFYVIDFEGEPMRTLEERRRLNSPLKDVSGMLRSLDYAISSAALSAGVPVTDRAVEAWRTEASDMFTAKYRDGYSPSMPYLPRLHADASDVLRFFLLEKAVYELFYEMNNRPGWISIPLSSLIRLSGPDPGAS